MPLVTKFAVPLVRADLVARPRLTRQLQIGIQRPLTLIAAPAGFGKTTALSNWLADAPCSAAWLSLEHGDDDLARFWSHVFTAVERAHSGSGEAARTLLRVPAPQQPVPIETILTVWINSLAELADEVVLILDDYHLLTAPAIHQSVNYLLEHLPARLHVVIATRADPPLPLARLRAGGRLAEVRAAELRFTAAEAATFLTRAFGLDLAAEDIAALEERTEGWIAGLRLAGLAMQAQQDVAAFLQAFTGSQRYIIDYLAEEVLAQQSEPVQTFLLRTAILERLEGSLCEAVLGMADGTGGPDAEGNGQAMLERVERANLFLVPLDSERRWYRYHQLFAEALRHHLQRTQAALIPGLHRRASAWYERHDLPYEAIHHALAAADSERAARLIGRNAEGLVKRGELATLRAWLDALPDEVVRSRVELGLWHGWLLAQSGQFDAAEQLLRDLEDRLCPSPGSPSPAASAQLAPSLPRDDSGRQIEFAGRLAATRAYIAFRRGDALRTIALAREALAHLRTDQTARGLVAWYLGIAYLWRDESAAGVDALTQARDIGEVAGNAYAACMATYELAQTQVRQGHLHQAELSCQRGLDAEAVRGQHAAATGPVQVGRGDLQREWNQLDAAAIALREGMAHCQQTGNMAIVLQGTIALARVRQAQGDAAEAARVIEEIAQHVRTSRLPPINVDQFTAWHARLSLAQGDRAVALRWAREHETRVANALGPPREAECQTWVRLLIAQQRPAVALPLVARLLELAERQGRMGNALEYLVLQALAQQACGDEAGAVKTIAQALALAQPEGYIRLFVDEGAPMARLLVRLRAHRGAGQPGFTAYCDRLLALLSGAPDAGVPRPAPAGPASGLAALDEPLSERELAVLRLIIAGCSNQEIAGRLVLALSTVKWYINAIYGKLQVASRTRAIARARELHLAE